MVLGDLILLITGIYAVWKNDIRNNSKLNKQEDTV